MQAATPLIGEFDGGPATLISPLTKIQLEFCREVFLCAGTQGVFSEIVRTHSPIIRTLLKRWPVIQGPSRSVSGVAASPPPEPPENDRWISQSVDGLFAANPEGCVQDLLQWLAPYQARLDETRALHHPESTDKGFSIVGPVPHPDPERGGDCVVLHLGPTPTEHRRPLRTIWRSSAQAVAQGIARDWPTVSLVAVRSWIVHRMDGSFSRRLGFDVSENEAIELTSNASWGQLLNLEGDLHRGRVNSFLKTRELPWKVKSAEMPAKAFIRRHRPGSMAGRTVTLLQSGVDFRVHRRFKRKLHAKWERIRRKERRLERFVEGFFMASDPPFLSSAAFFHLRNVLRRNRHLSLAGLNEHVAKDHEGAELTRLFREYVRDGATVRESFRA